MNTNEHYNNLAESFSQLPVNTDACCTNSLDVIITPVRYAIDDLININDTGLKKILYTQVEHANAQVDLIIN